MNIEPISSRMKTIASLFDSNVTFRVPDYQRRYCWGPADIDDLMTAVLSLSEDHDRDGNPLMYGTVAVQFRWAEPGKANVYDIVDGGQRFVTVYLIIRSVVDLLEESGIPEVHVTDRLRNVLANRASYRWANMPYTACKVALHPMDLSATDNGRFGNSKLQNADKQIRERLREWFDARGVITLAERAQALERGLLYRLQFNTIDMSAKDDPYEMFEGLNAPGVPLLPEKVLQAHMLGCRLPSEAWPDFEDPFWAGSLGSQLLLAHVSVHWRPQMNHPFVPKAATVRAAKDLIAESDVGQVADGIRNSMATVRWYAESGTKDVLWPWPRYQLAKSTLPLSLLLVTGAWPAAARKLVLAVWDSWYMRLLMATRRPASTRTLSHIGRMLRDRTDVRQACCDLLAYVRRIDAVSYKWYTDRVLRTIASDPQYRPTQKQRPFLLRGVEELLISQSMGEYRQVPTSVTLEHLVPRSSGATYVERIGNLTLIAGRNNSRMRNLSWSEKRPLLAESQLLINRDLLTIETMDQHAVERRGCTLLELMLERWPGPDARVWQTRIEQL